MNATQFRWFWLILTMAESVVALYRGLLRLDTLRPSMKSADSYFLSPYGREALTPVQVSRVRAKPFQDLLCDVADGINEFPNRVYRKGCFSKVGSDRREA